MTLVALLAISMGVHAQINVSGVVSDPQGEPLIGASVSVEGVSNGAITDIDGNYTLNNVASDATLIFSYVGYEPQKVKVDGRTLINITMQENISILNEVVVVGYGSLSRKELSSSIVQVDKAEFAQGAVNNPMEMLAGKVAGLNISTKSPADPNGSSDLQVRGATSLTASNGPLVVIDGVAGGDIRNLAPQDIESITVLKDAASAAIYGTRGANGVILVTTRKGSGTEGKAIITYDSYFAMNFAKDRPEVLSSEEWRRARRGQDYGYDTDWYSELMRDFSYDTNQYVSIDGSTSNGYYGASLNYKRATGLDIVSEREEYGGRFNVQQRAVNDHLQLTASLIARKVKETWGNTGTFDTALGMNPTMPIFNEDGTYFQPTSPTNAQNPVQNLRVNTSQGNRTYVLGTADLKYNIWRNDVHTVNTQLSYSLHYNDLKSDYYTPSTSGESYWNGYKGRATITWQKWWTNRLEWIGNYFFNKDDNDVKVMLGYTYERTNWEQLGAENKDFTFDNTLWHSIGSGSYLTDGKANMYSGKSESSLIGFFGRVNYSWRNMIFASASLRYEGSTKFGADHKWGSFPAASIAWEIAQMPFMEQYADAVQSIKPRFSYGVTGRSDFDAYRSLATYSTSGNYLIDGAWTTGYAPSSNANPKLGWEKSTSANYGVDFMLFNRLHGSIEYFDRRSQDLLYNYTAPQPPYVYSSILVNVGTTRNTGVELSLTGDILTDTPVTWTSGINYSYGTTKLTKLSNEIYKASYLDLYQKPGVGSNEYFFRVQEGGKIGQYYGYEYAGVDDNGNIMVWSGDGEKIYATQATPENDKRFIGNGAPKHFLSWNNTLRWRDFDLSFMFQGAFGFEIFNMRKYGMGLRGSGSDNVLREAYLDDKDVFSSAGVITSYFLEKGDYFKLENVTLGYTIPFKKRTVIDSLRVFCSAKNLFTITGYSGNDPSIVTSTGITPGIDVASAYPSATQVSFGVTLRFK
ncbi:MAG: SusC/RagA family TonB-linked outer membrane protein [Bacteroidales bacterium]|nr:SusC/RagA family TonB-linked outer membrane protein [Bacteroidales bacterium]